MAARRPLILAGGGAVESASELRALAERLQAPVALTINAKGLLPRGHDLSIGSTQSLAATRALVREADVVLAVGTELGETDYDVVFDNGFAIDGKLIRIDIDSQQVMRNFPPDVAIAADAKLVLAALDHRLATRPLPPREAEWGAPRVRAVRAAVAAGYDAPIRSQAVLFETVLDTLPDAIVVGDSTRPIYAGNLVFEAAAPRSWFNSSTGYGTLGYGLPAAIGARLASGNRPVICLIGDGGLQFTMPELASAVEAAVPVIVLLWNNSGYAEIKRYMVDRDIEPVGVDIYTPDFLTLARGFGCCAASADTPGQLANELKQAAGRRVPTLIEIDERKWFDQVSGDPE